MIFSKPVSGARQTFLSGAVSAWLGLLAMPISAEAQTAGFVDTFDKLDLTRWYVSDGWSNGAHQNCIWSAKAVAVVGGELELSFKKGQGGRSRYICGEVQTRARYSYGTYEARLKTPRWSGLNAAFFTYIGPTNGAPHDEIDFEILLKDPSRVQLNSHVSGKGGNEHFVTLPKPSDEAFIDYAFVWEPSRLRWYINGELVHTITESTKVPTNPQKIFFSLWGSDTLTDWMGPFKDPGRKALVMEVDRVAFTPIGAACLFPESVACSID